MAKNEAMNIEEMLRQLHEGIKKQAVKPNILGYEPHLKQLQFHKLPQKKRLYIGGNRSGKSYGSVAEDVWWLTGTHPYRETPPPPIRGRVVTVDLIYGLEQIILPLFKILLPNSELKGGSWDKAYSKQNRVLTLKNGSTCEFMSYEQDEEKFAGTSRHFVHYDEEPPNYVFKECNARLVDTGGSWWISMTPTQGLTWTYEELFEPWDSGKDTTIGVIQVDMLDNPHITEEAAEAYLETLPDDERKARESGNYMHLGGKVYKNFDVRKHVIEPQIPPKNWYWYLSLDHGYNNPTAALWHAVSPLNEIITFAELYVTEHTVDMIAKLIHENNAAFGKVPDFYIADPAIAQRSGITGTSIQVEYSIRGIPFALANNNVEIGVNKVQMYLHTNPNTGKPWRQITENCVNFIEEMKHLRWKTYSSKKMQYDLNPQEQIHKKNDHACDSDRYFHTFMPDLSPEQMGLLSKDDNSKKIVPVYGSIDTVLAAMVKGANTTWKPSQVGEDMAGLEY